MYVLNSLTAALAFLGRHGTITVALSFLVALVVPGTAAFFKPLLGPSIITLLVLAFLRVQPAALFGLMRRPILPLAATVWMMLVVPAVLALVFNISGIATSLPGLYLMLMLQACSPAITSAPALAALVGADVALNLAGLLLTTIVSPLVAAVFTSLFLGASIIAPLDLALRLVLLLTGSAIAATIIRRFAGNERIVKNHNVIDGLNVIAMFIFAMAAMDGVAAQFIAAPLFVASLIALAFAVSFGTMLLTILVFLPAGREPALSLGVLTANRHVAIMLAATGFAVPELSWLYFGLLQFPIYLLPLTLKPIARRLGRG